MINEDTIEDHLTDAAIEHPENFIDMEAINNIADLKIRAEVLRMATLSSEEREDEYEHHDCGTLLGDGCEHCWLRTEYMKIIG